MPEAAAPTTRLSLTYLAVVSAATIASQGLPAPELVRDLVYSAISVSVVIAIIVGARRWQPRMKGAWYLMAVGQCLWVIADTSFNWQQDVLHVTAFPTYSDFFYLLGYPVFAVSLAMLARSRSLSGRSLGPLLDSATVTAGLSLLSWVLLARPTIEVAGQSTAAAIVSAAYPIMDILLIGALVRLISSTDGRPPAFRYLLGALALLIAADTLSVAFDLFATNTVYSVEYLWLFSYAFWGAAVLHPSMAKLSEPGVSPDVRFRGYRLLSVVLATMMAPAILALQQITGTHIDVWAVVIGSVVMFVLVVVRMSLAIDQIASVHHALEGLQDDLALQARHDALTGLANRTQMLRLVAGALGRTRRRKGTIGLLFIDLDGFKEVNDNHGHRAGDEVLREVARRMVDTIRTGDFVGRLGGDEFLVGIEDVSHEADTTTLANRLIAAVSRPIQIDENSTVQVGASVGIAIGRGGETDVETLLHEADLATYRAKAAGRGCVELFDSTARAALKEQNATERALTSAIANDELELHYQPIVNLRTGLIDCYEALVRWNRPGWGLLPPSEFLAVAESSDLINDLDVWVLHAAIDQLSRWNDERGDREIQVAVNVSARHVSRQRIRTDIDAALLLADVDPGQIVVEVTETALMDGSAAAANLQALREAGLVVSLDDFGTGYQSSTQLSRLPIDIVKIDREFVDPHSKATRSLLELMVKAAHAFGVTVVAEGVETEDQLELVRELDCGYAQGYFFGRPVPADQLTRIGRRAEALSQSAEGPPSSNVLNPSSSRTVTPSSSALSALEPALSPTTT